MKRMGNFFAKKRALFAGMLAIGLVGVSCGLMPAHTEAKVNFDGVFDFEPHRGGRDARPENTLYSYAYAIESGATSIECDMQLAGDGEIVMSHNPILNPEVTRDADGKYIEAGKYDIRKMTVAEIQKFDVAKINPDTEYYKIHGMTQVTSDHAQIPTLRQLLQLIKDSGNKDVFLNIETKSYPDPEDGQQYANNADPEKFLEAFNKLIKEYDMEDRVILQSFDWNTLRLEHEMNPRVSLSALWSEQPSWGRGGMYLRQYEKEKSPYLGGLDIKDFKGDAVKAAKAIGADVISPYYAELSLEDVQEAHELGMKVVPWTVNDPKDMAMLYDMGVDGIISDKPWILRSFLEKRGAKLRERHAFFSPYHLEGDHMETADSKKIEGGMDATY